MLRRHAVVLALIASVLPSCGRRGTAPAEPVPLADALARRERGEAVIIDVRSREAYAEGHVPGALNIPVAEIPGRTAEIRGIGKLPILYCG